MKGTSFLVVEGEDLPSVTMDDPPIIMYPPNYFLSVDGLDDGEKNC